MKYLKLFEQNFEDNFKQELKFINGNKIIPITVEVADDFESRTKGLMGREYLDPMSGMLFIFDREKPLSFWMKNTPLSLDIIYVNSKKQIVSISKNTEPYSTDSIPSIYPAIYVIEVESGFVDTHGIFVGDKVLF